MPINVTDFDSMIKDFMIAQFKVKYPNMDTSDGSPFDDLYIKPMQTTIEPLIALINTMEIRNNLDNAEYMTNDELDQYVVGNYMISRKTGQSAVATETLNFVSISGTNNLVIPAGVTFSTSQGLKFQNVDRKEFTPTELYTLYNPSTMLYEVKIPLNAMGVGSIYNVAENQITNVDVQFNANLISVTNESASIGGEDEELNVDYAQRAKEYYISRHLGTPYGYRQFILDNFNEVQDIYTAGFGDEFMTRDQVLVYDSKTNQPVLMSIGGKVDIYIKGSNYSSAIADITINSNTIFLQTDYDSITPNSFTITNRTDSTKTVVYTSAKDATTGKCVISIQNTDSSHLSYDPSIVSTIDIYYRYNDGSGGQVDKIETFTVGLTSIELLHPFKDVIQIQDISTKTSYADAQYYTITQSGIIGTSREQTILSFNPDTTNLIPNGHTMEITYTINSTINSLDTIFNFDENRVVTTDMLFKEAQGIYVNIAFKIKLLDSQTLDSFKINIINNSIADFFKQAPLGQQTQESDIISWLYNDTDIQQFLDFIVLPFDSFYVATDISAPIIVKRDGTFLNTSKITYPILNKMQVDSL